MRLSAVQIFKKDFELNRDLTPKEVENVQREILSDYLTTRAEQQIDDMQNDDGCGMQGHSFPIFGKHSKYRFICDYCKAKLPKRIINRILAVEFEIGVTIP